MNTDPAAGRQDVPKSDVIDLLAEAFPDVEITGVSALSGEGPNASFAVATGDGNRYVLKCASDGDATEHLRRELAVTGYVRRETDVPAVEPITYGFDGSGTSLPYVVTRWADGETLNETLSSLPPYAHPELFSNVGGMLATLHTQTSFDESGAVVPTGPASFEVEPAENWPELFAGRLADHVEALQGTRFEDVAEDVWSSVTDRLHTLDTGEPPVLLHGDVGEGNVTYDGTAVSHVLDWEFAFVGHPEYDLCRAEVRYFLNDWGRPTRLQAMLHSGYRNVRELQPGFESRRRCYLATFYLLVLTTFPDWAPTLTDDLDGFADRISEKVRGVLDQNQ